MAQELRSSPAALRNRQPIADVLRDLLPAGGEVLEVASGTGEHVMHFATEFPSLRWQPTDREPQSLAEIRMRRDRAQVHNVAEPKLLDAASEIWPVAAADAILCINMVHISPWRATEGLMRGAGLILRPGAPMILYGPYRRDGVSTAPSNEAFDLSLKERNPEWGLRTFEEVSAEAERWGFRFERLFEMPANNLTLVFRKN